ncbi:MAG: ABC transporter ATP-binding protein, partial [Myxococcota bacterium]
MALRFTQITHAYGSVPVLSELDLDVEAGEITCLLGPSGGGKSTLLRLAAGLESVQAGRIEIDGEAMASPEMSLPPERRPIGMMFQENALFPHLSVEANVGFGLSKLSREKRSERVESLLHLVGCDALASRFPHQLSGG